MKENILMDHEGLCNEIAYHMNIIYQNKSFTERVKEVVRQIPAGNTLSYSTVAMLAGNGRASRVVGSIMKNNYDETIPCHRVIKINKELGDYNRGGTSAKRLKLIEEKAIW